MKHIAPMAARIDAACARLNDGLFAVAVVLAIIAGGVVLAQHADDLAQSAVISAP